MKNHIIFLFGFFPLMPAGFASLAGCGNGGPTVTLVRPGDGAEVFGIVRLEAEASSGEGALSVRFHLDSADGAGLIGSGATAEESTFAADWYTAELANGEHVLIAVVQARKGQTAQASITVSVANLTRADAIPPDAVKATPDTDQHPPVLEAAFSHLWEDPVPVGAPINTAGGEDSPFITPDGNTLYFWFTPDVSIPAEGQVDDRVTGIYRSDKTSGGEWTEPEQVYLTYYDEPSLDGAHTIRDDTMWFASARAGNLNGGKLNMWTAELENDRWTNWTNTGELFREYEVGELHVTADGNEIYFHSTRSGGRGGIDIWVTRRVGGEWQEPENVAAVNSEYTDGWPFVSEDGSELWFLRGIGAPEIWRSLKTGGEWQEPERILWSFAAEPTLDNDGNIYFAHHYWDTPSDSMIEADFYVCRRK